MSALLKIEVHADAEAVSRRGAAWIAEAAGQAIGQRDRFVMALSGGRTPWRMLSILSVAAVDWPRVHLAQVDERVAPAGSPDRNLTHLRDALLARAGLPAAEVHPMPVEDADLDAASERYSRLLVGLAGSPPLLDLVQLGLGADGHTASLVLGDPALEVTGSDVAATAPYHGRRRMTLTFSIINRARRILWLVTGEDKAEAVARLVQGDPSLLASRVSREPALLLADRAAAALVEPQP
ncbi:MAG: 6-phosphogluconolactonase [Pseudomonadota bacterium]